MAILLSIPTGYCQKSILRLDKIVENDSLIPDEWMATIVLLKSDSEVFVKGFGFSREMALKNIQEELNQMETQ